MLRNICEHDWESSNFFKLWSFFLHMTPKILSYECHVCKMFQFSSVSQARLTLCDPMDCSTSGLPVHHQLPEFAQTHLHGVGDASNHLTLCRPLLLSSIFPSIRAFLMSQPFASSGQSVGASVSASNEYSGLSSFRINW